MTRSKLSLLVNVLFWWEEVNGWRAAEDEKVRFPEGPFPPYSEDDNLTRTIQVEQGTDRGQFRSNCQAKGQRKDSFRLHQTQPLRVL